MAFTGGGGGHDTGNIFIALNTLNERKITAPEIINRLRPQLNRLPVASTFLQASQDLRIGGRRQLPSTSTPCNPTMFPISPSGPAAHAGGDNAAVLQDVNTDQQNGASISSKTTPASRLASLGPNPQSLDQEIYASFVSPNFHHFTLN